MTRQTIGFLIDSGFFSSNITFIFLEENHIQIKSWHHFFFEIESWHRWSTGIFLNYFNQVGSGQPIASRHVKASHAMQLFDCLSSTINWGGKYALSSAVSLYSTSQASSLSLCIKVLEVTRGRNPEDVLRWKLQLQFELRLRRRLRVCFIGCYFHEYVRCEPKLR